MLGLPVPLSRIGAALDFVLRLAFFAAAPFVLVLVAALFPVSGALIQIGVGLGAFFAGEALRRVAARSRLVEKALSSQLAFEAHYRAHPPRPFLYYVFYPLLVSVLARGGATPRREFLLFKGYTLVELRAAPRLASRRLRALLPARARAARRSFRSPRERSPSRRSSC